MKRFYTHLTFLLFFSIAYTQVGINTTTPAAQLEIKSSNQVTPANNDGIIIPKIDAFPVTNPTAAQNSMMVYLTTTSAGKSPGFYYWDNATTSWKGVGENPDADFYKTGTTVPPYLNSDGMYHIGNVAIGKNTAAVKLDVEETSSSISSVLNLNHSNPSSFGTTYAVKTLLSTTQPAGILVGTQNYITVANAAKGFGNENLVNGTSSDEVSCTSNRMIVDGTGIKSGTTNFIGGSSTGTVNGVNNLMTNVTSIEQNGIRTQFNSSNNASENGVLNFLAGTGNGDKSGIRNSITNTGSGIHYGTYSYFTGTGTGTQYGSWNRIDVTGAGDKYCSYNLIPTTAGGVQYGVYSNVLKATGYSGYFLGRFSIGTTTANNYILPASRGTANQIMQTDATGNVTWQNPTSFAWSVTGNSGTSPTTNFIGTTDDNDVVFKRNNIRSGLLNSSDNNTSFGVEALNPTSVGGLNTAIGYRALATNTSGSGNSAIGDRALAANTSGGGNNAFGYLSLTGNTTGIQNNAHGSEVLLSNTTGSYNSGFGYRALNGNNGNYNSAFGNASLLGNKIASNNVAVGYRALGLQNFDNGGIAYDSNNVAIGVDALLNNNPTNTINGTRNTAVGNFSLNINSTGLRNTALGYNTLNGITTGNYNTAIGANAYVGSNYSNSSAIGDGSAITASNQVRIGDTGVSSIGGYANWTNVSDKRFKKNILTNVPGLSFITKLKPVTYLLDVEAINSFLKIPENIRKQDSGKMKNQEIQTGFIAQEVEQAAKETNFDFSGVDKPKNENDFYGLRYAEFVVPLVKAVQEQQMIIEAQNKKIQSLEERLKKIEEKLGK